MIAIEVKVLPATATKPTRLKAIGALSNVNTKQKEQSLTVTYDYNGIEKESFAVAQTLANKYGWQGDLIGGQLGSGSWVFVFAPKS